MIDHLLVNLKKYYEGNEKNYIGKTINGVQNSIATFSYTPGCIKNNSGFDERFERYDSFKSDFLNGIRIIGQATLQNGDILLMIPSDYSSSGGYAQSLFVKLTDILKNGGVSHSHLTHSYRAFRLVRREISMAILKMLFDLAEYLKKDYPDQVVIPADTSVTFLNASYAGGQTMGNGFTAQKYVVEVKAELGNLYFCQVPKNTDGKIHLKGQSPDSASGYCYVGVRKSNCTPVVQNGGVTSLLTHLYQGLRHLLDRKVALVND